MGILWRTALMLPGRASTQQKPVEKQQASEENEDFFVADLFLNTECAHMVMPAVRCRRRTCCMITNRKPRDRTNAEILAGIRYQLQNFEYSGRSIELLVSPSACTDFDLTGAACNHLLESIMRERQASCLCAASAASEVEAVAICVLQGRSCGQPQHS